MERVIRAGLVLAVLTAVQGCAVIDREFVRTDRRVLRNTPAQAKSEGALRARDVQWSGQVASGRVERELLCQRGEIHDVLWQDVKAKETKRVPLAIVGGAALAGASAGGAYLLASNGVRYKSTEGQEVDLALLTAIPGSIGLAWLINGIVVGVRGMDEDSGPPRRDTETVKVGEATVCGSTAEVAGKLLVSCEGRVLFERPVSEGSFRLDVAAEAGRLCNDPSRLGKSLEVQFGSGEDPVLSLGKYDVDDCIRVEVARASLAKVRSRVALVVDDEAELAELTTLLGQVDGLVSGLAASDGNRARLAGELGEARNQVEGVTQRVREAAAAKKKAEEERAAAWERKWGPFEEWSKRPANARVVGAIRRILMLELTLPKVRGAADEAKTANDEQVREAEVVSEPIFPQASGAFVFVKILDRIAGEALFEASDGLFVLRLSAGDSLNAFPGQSIAMTMHARGERMRMTNGRVYPVFLSGESPARTRVIPGFSPDRTKERRLAQRVRAVEAAIAAERKKAQQVDDEGRIVLRQSPPGVRVVLEDGETTTTRVGIEEVDGERVYGIDLGNGCGSVKECIPGFKWLGEVEP